MVKRTKDWRNKDRSKNYIMTHVYVVHELKKKCLLPRLGKVRAKYTAHPFQVYHWCIKETSILS